MSTIIRRLTIDIHPFPVDANIMELRVEVFLDNGERREIRKLQSVNHFESLFDCLMWACIDEIKASFNQEEKHGN